MRLNWTTKTARSYDGPVNPRTPIMKPSADALHLLNLWSKALGLEGMVWDDEGVIELAVESTLEGAGRVPVFVTLEGDGADLLLSSEILAATDTMSAGLMRRVLATNSKLQSDCGAWLALVPSVGALCLLQRIHAPGMEYGTFEQHWLHFLDLRDQLVHRLQTIVQAGESANAYDADIPLRFRSDVIWV